MLTDICGNGNGEQLELNACMLAPATVLIRQPPTVVRKRSRIVVTTSKWKWNGNGKSARIQQRLCLLHNKDEIHHVSVLTSLLDESKKIN